MKKNKQNHTKKILLISAGLILAAVLIGLTYANRTKVKNFLSSDDSVHTTANAVDPLTQTNAVNEVNYGPSSPTDNSQINDQKNNAGQTTEKPVNSNLTATITNTRVVSSLAQVSVLISGTTSGNCLLNLSKSGSSDIQKTVSIIIRNGIATCEDFNIPVTSLSTGTWVVKVVLESGQTKSNPAEGNLQVGS